MQRERLVESITLIGKVSKKRSRKYSHLLIKYSRKAKIDPFLIAALIHRESKWKSRIVCKGNWGLMQVRVSKSVNKKLIGKERKLFDPEFNIKVGVKMLSYWRAYHFQKCAHKNHFWWSHYQWGRRVKDNGSGMRVWKMYLKYVSHSRGAWW